MPRKAPAKFQISDIIVWVICPHCESVVNSPGFTKSAGWDKHDVESVGRGGEVTCASKSCKRKFPLPAELFRLMPAA